MTRRRWLLVASVAVVSVVVAYAATLERDPTIGRAGSEQLPGGQPVLITRVPASYSIRYRLEELLDDSIRVSTENVSVRRPGDARVDTTSDGRSVSTIVWRLGRNSSRQGDAEALVSDQPPEAAGADVRLEHALDLVARADRVERRERRRVAGRVCQVVRTRRRLVAAELTAPTDKNYVDSCIDSDGLLLEEVQVVDGKRRLRRTATRVNLEVALGDDLFAVGTPNVDVKLGGGSTRRIDPASSPPGRFWQLDQPPPGFSLLGRFTVVPPQPENFTDPAREGFRRAETTDVFVNGVDIITLTRGATLRGHNAWERDSANATIDLGGVGTGEVVVTGRGNEVRALLGAGRYVRVSGTRPVDELAAIARQLHEVPGTELKFLD